MVGATAGTPGRYVTTPQEVNQADQLPVTVFVAGTAGTPGTEQCANVATPLATTRAPTPQQQAQTLVVNWEQNLQKGTIEYVPDKAPMLVGLPGCFWLTGVSPNTQTTNTQTATYQDFQFSTQFRFTATLKQVDWSYGDGGTRVGDAGIPWVYQQQQFCSNSHTYTRITNPGQTVEVTATEEWSVSVDTWETTTWGYQDHSWQPALSNAANLVAAPVNLTVIQEEAVGVPPSS